ncbi:phosphatase PAP2 family protein [Peptostreptococcus stomatis]|uniref:PAP2 family protein n=1 Tax=Peptostreptococcus stomatis DSM 17678 TaxID=596315 RepID=E0E1N6_9FIRM|nr:phosphatase PAP2 family protein [Peptostreptococcus stomatis]EFM65233.1 PAP2 family protein [Peptostreptococcus stomatis DSM 17678]MBL6465000.1 phosphatase PAP2 family protein [Peptostreptococcus stomatis]
MNFDMVILDLIQSNIRTGFMDAIMPFITQLGDAGLIWIILSIGLIIPKKTRKIGFVMIIALILNGIICNIILKPMLARIRPFDVNTAIKLLINKPRDFSFPSGHTSASFTAASVLFFRKSKLFVPSLVLAFLISFSRLYLYVHYPSDVLAGLVLGILCGYIGHRAVASKEINI